MKKKIWIISIVLAVLLIIGIAVGISQGHKEKTDDKHQIEFNMVVKTKQFLREKVNYPETFDYVSYPTVEWYEDEIVYAIISGQFKCANAFGVYSTHKFAVAMNPKNFEIISYKII